jgi:hypothetical protein
VVAGTIYYVLSVLFPAHDTFLDAPIYEDDDPVDDKSDDSIKGGKGGEKSDIDVLEVEV